MWKTATTANNSRQKRECVRFIVCLSQSLSASFSIPTTVVPTGDSFCLHRFDAVFEPALYCGTDRSVTVTLPSNTWFDAFLLTRTTENHSPTMTKPMQSQQTRLNSQQTTAEPNSIPTTSAGTCLSANRLVVTLLALMATQ